MFKIQSLLLMFIFLLFSCSPVKIDKVSSAAPLCLKSQSKCFVETRFGRVEVLFNQDKILTEIPFKIYLKTTAISEVNENITEGNSTKHRYEISQVKSYMEGKEMFMGKIPVFFALSKQTGDMVAETLLGSCSEDQMVWRLWLTVFFESTDASPTNKEDKESLQATFFIDFTSSRF